MNAPDKLMKKISLSLLAGSAPGKYSLTPSAISFDFIYGAGSAGLSPFEISISELNIEESKDIQLSSHEIKQFFGGLYTSLRQAIGLHIVPEVLFIQAELTSCVEANPSEIVKAIASSLGSCGSGGSCGCGCG